MSGNSPSFKIDPCVKPSFGQDRGNAVDYAFVFSGGSRIAEFRRSDLFRIDFVHPAEAAKLTFNSVEVTVVVRLQGDEPVPANIIVDLDSLHHVDGEWKSCDPGLPCGFVSEVELGRRRILNNCFRTEIIRNASEQMRF